MDTFDDHWLADYFDVAPQCTWILDSQGKVVKANQAANQITNQAAVQEIGVLLWDVTWPGLNRQNRRILKWAVNQAVHGQPAGHDLEFRRRGQPDLTINFTCRPIPADNGGIKFIIAEGWDVTTYKRTSEALSQSEARFKTIFEAAEIGILVKDVDGRMRECNPAFEAMLGYTVEEIRRLEYLDITFAADKSRSRKLFQALVNGKRKDYTIEKRYLHKSGNPVWVQITASLVLETDRQAQFVIAMVENIQTRKEIENELTELQRRLTHGREMERLRIAQDLHDGPLQELIDISFRIHELIETQKDRGSLAMLNDLQATANNLAHSIRAICGELRPPTLVPFGLSKTIQSHSEQFRETHPEINVRLDLQEDGQALSETVRIVLFRIYQASLNNIVRHAQASQVKILFRLDEKQAILRIQDNGKGFNLPKRWITLAREGHLGIVGARERAIEIGGDLQVITKTGKGTLVQAVVPIKEVFGDLDSNGEKI